MTEAFILSVTATVSPLNMLNTLLLVPADIEGGYLVVLGGLLVSDLDAQHAVFAVVGEALVLVAPHDDVVAVVHVHQPHRRLDVPFAVVL